MGSVENAIIERAIRATEERVFPGCVIGVVRKNGERIVLPFGRLSYDDISARVAEDTIYDVASITKSIPTSSLALALIDRGALSLDDQLIEYVPEFANNFRDKVLIKHLLTYTIDSAHLSQLKDNTSDEILAAVCARDFAHEPGTVFHYSNTAALLLGLVVERVFGVGLAQAARDTFFKPLHMTKTGFMPSSKLRSMIAPTEKEEWRGLVHGVVHDESAYAFAQEERAVGHAGLFSTVPDLLNFLQMLLSGGSFGGRNFLSQKILYDMRMNQIAHLNESTGLGWELNQPHFMGKYAGAHTFGKTGFTGTSIVCDIERGIGFVILSNRTFPKRSADSSAINSFRADIADVVLSSS